MKAKKVLALALSATLALPLAACGAQPSENAATTASAAAESSAAAATSSAASTAAGTESAAAGTNVDGSNFKIAMITDTGGINDQSFNQSAWEGLQQLQKDTGADTTYIESKQAADFTTNFDNLSDQGYTFLWGIGFACADAVLEAAQENPEIQYAIVDNSYEETPENVTGVMFRAQEPSFMVGYIAAAVSQTNKVGFVGGIEGTIIDQFQYGYEAGVAYANKQLGKDVKVSVQYAESFSDSAKGKAIASKMFTDGCDVVYHAAGGTGTGVIEAAKEAGKWAIGVDRDQAYLAPENVLTSALKNVNVAVEEVSKEYMQGKKIGGQTLEFGLTEGAVGIPEDHANYSDDIYNAALKIADDIKAGSITVPANEEEYNTFLTTLK